MAAFLFLLLLSSFQTLSAQQRQLNISLGSSISPQGPNSSWLSASGLFAFGFYRQGDDGYAVGVFIAGIPENTTVWTANRENPVVPENSTLQLTTDGKLLLLGQEQNISVLGLSNPSDSIAAASMLDTGNFVLYNSVHSIIWQSFDYPTNSLLPGQRLLAEKEHELISSASETDDSKGTFLLKMQKDGYLVQYPVGTPFSIPYAYWQPLNAPGLGEASSLSLDNNGRLYLSNSTFTQVISAGGNSSTVKLHLAKVDVDGIFRLYSHSINQGSWTKEWESLSDECAPKGVCGFNSYCIRQGTEAVCECLPGFDFLDETNKRLGCVRNSTVERCKQENGGVVVEYDFRPSENIAWVASPYAVSEKRTRAECQDACRDDCNCQVVFFDGRNCTMQKLPLRFGRRNLEESTVALIKVSKNVVGGDGEEKTPPTTIVNKKEVRLDILIPSVSFFTVAVLMLVMSGVLIHHRRVWEYKLIADSKKIHLNDHEAPQAFTYKELQQATNDFKEKLGEGAFGHVYKGYLPDRQKEVAVKRLEKVFAEGGAEMEFQNELRMIGKTHHRNLVRLLGFCLEGHQRLLVYEYMSNGSLANLLFEQENRPSLKERIALALDIARGILYLHEECEAQIIHCDIKPQNILLDKHRRARISDFGLAKLLNYDQTKTYTGIRGTKGYAAPEWHKRLPVTVKADVYSYGIVLLEILCGRRSVETSLPEDEIVLEYWAYSCFETGNLKKLVGEDEEEEEVDKTKLERMIKIAIWCIQDDPSLRPSIKKVMLMLEGTVDIPIPPSPTSILSTI